MQVCCWPPRGQGLQVLARRGSHSLARRWCCFAWRDITLLGLGDNRRDSPVESWRLRTRTGGLAASATTPPLGGRAGRPTDDLELLLSESAIALLAIEVDAAPLDAIVASTVA